MNILVFSYHYIPEQSTCSIKNKNIVQALLDKGYNVTVIALNNVNNERIYINENNKLKIIYVRSGLIHQFLNKSSSKENKQEVNTTLNNKSKLFKIKQKIFIPDGAIDWYFEIKSNFYKNKEFMAGQDVIISISSPYTDHIIGYKFAKKYKKPLYLSYGDPWIFETNIKRGKLRYLLESIIEKRIIKFSRKMYVITEANKNKYIEIYGLNTNKIGTFNIGVSEKKIEKSISNNSDEDIKMIYGGSLNPNFRNPYPLINYVKDNRKYKVWIFNNDLPELLDIHSKNIIISKQIPYEKFLSKLCEFQCIILFGNNTDYQVPGKIFDFMATGKHILYIKNNDSENDGTLDILKKYNNFTVCINNEQSINEALSNIKIQTPNIEDVMYNKTLEDFVNNIDLNFKNRKEKGVNF